MERILRNFAARNERKKQMETITLTFNPNTPIGANINAFVADLPKAVKVSKTVKPARKRRSNYQITLDTIREAREGKKLNHYDSVDELFEKLGI